MAYSKGQIVKLNDSGTIKNATVTKDGVDSKGRVRVRPSGFPMDMSITTEVNDRLYVVTD